MAGKDGQGEKETGRPYRPPAPRLKPGEDEAHLWAGAGVGGLRTPARCLDSRVRLPRLQAPKHGYRGQRFAATALWSWALLMLERPLILNLRAWL